MRFLKAFWSRSSADQAQKHQELQIPESFALRDSGIQFQSGCRNYVPPIRSIAMIGANHDQNGNLWKDDKALLQNVLDYLAKKGLFVSADARFTPMSLRYNEDFLQVQPQVDLAILCYVFDDLKNKFIDRANTSFRAQSQLTHNVEPSQRYEMWRKAIEQTDAKIVVSLGHSNEITVTKILGEDFSLILDPENPSTDLPPITGKPPRKQHSYGLAVSKKHFPCCNLKGPEALFTSVLKADELVNRSVPLPEAHTN